MATSSMDFKFSMCAENVERSAAMDCSSPMSASTRSKIGNSARSAATGMPDCAESAARPTVLSETVLPPVLGPLMTSTVSSPPRRQRKRNGFAPLWAQRRFEHGIARRIRVAANCPA